MTESQSVVSDSATEISEKEKELAGATKVTNNYAHVVTKLFLFPIFSPTTFIYVVVDLLSIYVASCGVILGT